MRAAGRRRRSVRTARAYACVGRFADVRRRGPAPRLRALYRDLSRAPPKASARARCRSLTAHTLAAPQPHLPPRVIHRGFAAQRPTAQDGHAEPSSCLQRGATRRRYPSVKPAAGVNRKRSADAVRRRVPSRRRDAARGARPTTTREARGAAARPARRRPSPARSPSPSCPSCSTDRRTRRRSARRPSGSSGRRSAPSRGAGRPTTPGRGRSARAARWSRSDRP